MVVRIEDNQFLLITNNATRSNEFIQITRATTRIDQQSSNEHYERININQSEPINLTHPETYKKAIDKSKLCF